MSLSPLKVGRRAGAEPRRSAAPGRRSRYGGSKRLPVFLPSGFQRPRRFDALRQMRSGPSVALLVGVAMIQCYATRTDSGCAPLSEHATMAECRKLASEYQKFDTRDLRIKGVPAVVSYHCAAAK
jgi:hypothetical protein